MEIQEISYNYFHPLKSELPKMTQAIRLIAVIASAILSLGICPLVLAMFYDKKYCDITGQASPQATKTQNIFESRIGSGSQDTGKLNDTPPLNIPSLNTIFEPPKQYREELQDLLMQKWHCARDLSEALFGSVEAKKPAIKKNLDDFSERYCVHIAKIQEVGGWEPLKEELGLAMADPYAGGDSFEEFRNQVNQLVVEQVNLILPLLNIKPIKMAIFGTPGWNSDVDIGMRPADEKAPLTTEQMVICKILCELTTVKVLGKFPGKGIDTEWYVDLMFKANSLQTVSAEKTFYTIDFIMAIVQAFKSLSDEEWEKFTDEELKMARDDDERELLTDIFEAIEENSKEREKEAQKTFITYHRVKELAGEGVEEKAVLTRKKSLKRLLKGASTLKLKELTSGIPDEKGEKKYNAQLLSDYPYLLRLGQECTKVEKKIQQCERSGNPDVHELERLYIEHDILFAVLNATQPESLYTLSGINSTLFGSGGQKYQRALEQKIKEHGQVYKDRKQRRKLKKTKKDWAELTRGNLQRDLDKMLETAHKSSIDQLTVATTERWAQFMHVYEHDKDIVAASKYLLRVAEGLQETLDLAKQSIEIDEELQKQVRKLHRFARRLEKCKRKFAINDFAARHLIMARIEDVSDPGAAKSKLKEIFVEYRHTFDGKVYKKSEKLSYLTQELEKAFKIRVASNKRKIITGQKIPKDSELLGILQAFVGYSRKKHSELEGYHEKALQMTHDHYESLKELAVSTGHKLCIEVRHFVQGKGLSHDLSDEALEMFMDVPC